MSDTRLRVCAYCRVSSKHTEQTSSIENQIKYYSELIEADPRYEFTGVYYEIESGRGHMRPQFEKMMEDARNRKFDVIYTKSVSRFARNTEVLLSAIRELRALDIMVYFELEGLNSSDYAGELLLTIYAALAQAESDDYSQLLLMSHKRRVEEGNHNACFVRIMGYSLDKDGKPVIDRSAEIVKKIFELAADGYMPNEIMRFLNASGIPSLTGRTFSGPTIRKIISNPIYKGVVVRNSFYYAEDGTVCKNDGNHPGIIDVGFNPAIVSDSLWDKAQRVLHGQKENKHNDDKGSLEKYKGLLFCSKCGHSMHAHYDKRYKTCVFGCYGKSRFGKAFCNSAYVPISALETLKLPDGKIYIGTELDFFGRKAYTYITEEEWLEGHKKKPAPDFYTDRETVELIGSIRCGYCGDALSRHTKPSKVIWVCKRKNGCRGITVPDYKIKKLEIGIYYCKKVEVDGKEYYDFRRQKGPESGV